MKDHGADLVLGGEVHGGHGADALAVEDNVLGGNSQPGPHRVPSGLNVRVQVLLRRLALAHAVSTVVVAEDVAVDPGAETQVE